MKTYVLSLPIAEVLIIGDLEKIAKEFGTWVGEYGNEQNLIDEDLNTYVFRCIDDDPNKNLNLWSYIRPTNEYYIVK